MADKFILLATSDVPEGYVLEKTLGICWGTEVRLKKKQSWIGPVRERNKKKFLEVAQAQASEARQAASERMIASAQNMGANGVVSVRLEALSPGGDLLEFVAYGTAVKVKHKSKK